MNELYYLGNKLSTARFRMDGDHRTTTTLNRTDVEVLGDATRWIIDYTFISSDGSTESLISHYWANRGKNITIPVPQPERIKVEHTGTATLAQAAAVDSNSITIAFAGAYQIDNGAYFTIGNDPKVYKITQSRSSANPGNVSFNIFPSLLVAGASGATIDFSPNLRGRYRGYPSFVSNHRGWIHQVTITVAEVL